VSRWDKFSDDELAELDNGLAWSQNESMDIKSKLCQDLRDEITEEEERRTLESNKLHRVPDSRS
jgi:hypothetical protein